MPYAALNLPFFHLVAHRLLRSDSPRTRGCGPSGCLSPFQILIKIVLPLSTPALATTALLAFIFAWNEFMFALTFMNVESAKTITVGVATLSGAFTYEIPLQLLAAWSIASSLPLIALVVIFQRRIVAGLMAGAGK